MTSCTVDGQTPSDPLAAARARLDKGDLAAAESLLRAEISLRPSATEAHFLLGYVLFREKKAKASLAEYTAGAGFRRPNADELKVVASDYVLLADYEDAAKWLQLVTQEKPADDEAWYLLGRARFNQNDFPAAIKALEHTLVLHPRHIEAENNIGLAWKELNETEKAREAYQNAIDWQQPTPTDAQPFLNLGILLAGEDHPEQALPWLEKAAALAPENATIHEQLALVYSTQNQLQRAQEELEKAVALAPDAASLHFKLGQLYRRAGLLDRAQQEFALCAQLNSTHSSGKTPNPFSLAAQPK
jgi:Flp pilus assembly protein TadD